MCGNGLSKRSIVKGRSALRTVPGKHRILPILFAALVVAFSACYEHGKIAGWISPPTRGIHGHPFDYEYVKFNS